MIKDQNLFKMPTQLDFIKKSLKNVCVDTVLLFVMLAVVGHFTINFWERFTLQSELTNMKHSLHSLKVRIFPIIHIGYILFNSYKIIIRFPGYNN